MSYKKCLGSVVAAADSAVEAVGSRSNFAPITDCAN